MPADEAHAEMQEATDRLMNQVVISLQDLAILLGIHVSTAQRAASRDDLPVPVSRIGQRWIVPAAPVREFLHLNGDGGTG